VKAYLADARANVILPPPDGDLISARVRRHLQHSHPNGPTWPPRPKRCTWQPRHCRSDWRPTAPRSRR
jgi:hypothetical protein